MKSLLIASFLFICIAASEVTVLSDSSFEEKTQMNSGSTTGRWFIKFYAPWCGHCKELAPTWEELAESVKGEVNVAEVDATSNSILAQKFGIQSFPTLYMINNGKCATYQGGRTLDELKEYALTGYENAVFDDCPTLPSKYDIFFQSISDKAGQYLAGYPIATCMVLLGGGVLVGIIFTCIFKCSGRKPVIVVDDEKKNN